MKTKKKVFGLILAAVLLVCVSVLGTVAYLTSTDKVTNTFTVGKVAITLDEAKVNTDGTVVENADRVKENKYHLLPGHTYVKDPTVHVEEGSENCWVFVQVDNGIKDIEDETEIDGKKKNTIAYQITDNGWKALEGQTGVYYKENVEGGTDLPVFASFTINGDIDNKTLEGYATADSKPEIAVTAYAVQADGVTSVNSAWDAVKSLQPVQP